MNSIVEKALGVNLKIMLLLRLYYPENSTYLRLHKFQAYVMYFIFLWPIPCFGILYLVMEDNLDMERVNYNTPFLIEMVCFVLKYFAFINNTEQIVTCIHNLKSFSSSTHLNLKQQNIQEEYVKICKRNTFIYLAVIIATAINWSIKPLYEKVTRLPIDLWLLSNISYKSYGFYLIYLYLLIIAVYMLAIATTDTLIGGLACLITAQLRILQDKLQHLDAYATADLKSKEKSDLSKDDIIYAHVQKCIYMHQWIIYTAGEFERCFSSTIFNQFLAVAVIICLCCIRISRLHATDIATIYEMASYINIMLCQMYFYCICGSTIFEESNNLTNAVYMSEWCNYDEKSKQALGILMTRSQKPIMIVSGGIIDLSLTTFVMTIKRAYSLIAVLNNYQ